MFSTPPNTGANMTLVINASIFNQFEGGQIGFFAPSTCCNPEIICVGLETIATDFFFLPFGVMVLVIALNVKPLFIFQAVLFYMKAM